MAIYAPGPIDVEPLPLAPPIVHDGTFAALGESIIHALGASDAVLGAHQLAIAGNTDAGLDATFTSTIGHAADVTAGQPDPHSDQTAVVLIDDGQGAAVYHDSVQAFLPQPDAPIGQTFKDFPTPDFGHPNQDPGANPPPEGI